jgi:hypothetical protein
VGVPPHFAKAWPPSLDLSPSLAFPGVQGYAALAQDMLPKMAELMMIVQKNMPYFEVDGRRVQGDDNPARFVLR